MESTICMFCYPFPSAVLGNNSSFKDVGQVLQRQLKEMASNVVQPLLLQSASTKNLGSNITALQQNSPEHEMQQAGKQQTVSVLFWEQAAGR